MRNNNLAKMALTILATLMVVGFDGTVAARTDWGSITGRVLDAQTNLPVAGATVTLEGTEFSMVTGADGVYRFIRVRAGKYILKITRPGYAEFTKRPLVVVADKMTHNDFALSAIEVKDNETRLDAPAAATEPERTTAEADALKSPGKKSQALEGRRELYRQALPNSVGYGCVAPRDMRYRPDYNTEAYDYINENRFMDAIDNPVSTFSIDVDAASYANLRRFINENQLPPVDAVRIEEMINYFDYNYPDPRGPHPFSITTEVADCPWNLDHKLVHIGLQGQRVDMEDLPPSNIVFLLDVSGSMHQPDKLPLLKASFRLLVNSLRARDRVAIVVYAGAAGCVLPSTPGHHKGAILDAIERLQAGGSTAGGQGIKLAYRIAQENFIEDGNNRIILATDGDFNVGVSSDAAMERLVEKEREGGVFLTVLGFGTGNLKDSKMEKIADKGNGHYAYIDDIMEAKKVLINEVGATLLTIAKDVKLQVEFNPATVASYRLIGYENRLMAREDFDDDTKDAGELGAGHSVTALYEIELTRDGERRGRGLKYSHNSVSRRGGHSGELLTVSFRYKRPTDTRSQLLERVVKSGTASFRETSDNFRFSAAVAQFGMILRDSEYRGDATLADVLAIARSARGEDREGYRAEFIRIVEKAELLTRPTVGRR